ncbi:hypothetical protein [Taklimakanibacter lacteus]|uniref:hypothetical protein n=1 Tax=Taklimakanibacter lacteus TaxID=2268456 RepID=UPI000E66FDE0
MAQDESVWEIFDIFETALKADPYSPGEPHPAYKTGKLLIYESPPVSRLPTIIVLYEIFEEEGVIKLWNFQMRPRR